MEGRDGEEGVARVLPVRDQLDVFGVPAALGGRAADCPLPGPSVGPLPRQPKLLSLRSRWSGLCIANF